MKKYFKIELVREIIIEVDEMNEIVKEYMEYDEEHSDLISDVVGYDFTDVARVIDSGGVKILKKFDEDYEASELEAYELKHMGVYIS